MKLIPYLVALLFAMVLIAPLVSNSEEKERFVENEIFAAEAAHAAAVYADSLQIVKKENDSLKTLLNQK